MSPGYSLSLDAALDVLEKRAANTDAGPAWPEASWDALRRSGVLGSADPTEFGGAGLDPLELLEGYQRLAGACLTTCFLLSQRDSACRRLRQRPRSLVSRRARRWRPVSGSPPWVWQLTTSRQHVRPVLTARLEGDGVRLDGAMPW